MTKFIHDVWRCVQQIPRGEVRTYGDVAQEVAGRRDFAQAVGYALRGADDTVRWWRVVRYDGHMRTRGDKKQIEHLKAEGVEIIPPGRVLVTKRLPYDPGNAGDLLKHSWLAVVTRWLLSKEEKEGTFKYADSFAGEWDYEATPAVQDRMGKLSSTALSLYSHYAWDRGRYLGSTGLVASVLKHERRPGEIWVGDKCKARVDRLVGEHNCRALPSPSNGYAVLESAEEYCLILLDPYADFLDESDSRVRHIIGRVERSSLLLFVLEKPSDRKGQQGPWDQLKQRLERSAACFIGTVPPLSKSAVRGESKYAAHMVFLPRSCLARAAACELVLPLIEVTGRVAEALPAGADASVSLSLLLPTGGTA